MTTIENQLYEKSCVIEVNKETWCCRCVTNARARAKCSCILIGEQSENEDDAIRRYPIRLSTNG